MQHGQHGGHRRVVYTVSTGGYDIRGSESRRLPEEVTRGIDFLRFVDRESLTKLSQLSQHALHPWRNVLLDTNYAAAPSEAPTTMSPALRLSRDVKIRPHQYPLLWRYEASLYVDSNVQIHHPVDGVFAHVARDGGNVDLAAFDFPRSLEDEAKWVERYLLTKQANTSAESRARLAATLAAQVSDYKAHGDHLWNRTMYGKVIVRHHSDRVRYFGERWWQELSRGVPRDQLAFRFCAADAGRKVGLRTASLGKRGRNGAKFWRYFRVHHEAGRTTGF